MRPDAGQIYRKYLSAVLLHGHASARACELGATDLYALNILQLTGAMTPGELSARTGLTTGPTTRLIDRLEQAGYVRRVPDPGDRRKVTVEPLGEPADLDRVMAPARKEIGQILGGTHRSNSTSSSTTSPVPPRRTRKPPSSCAVSDV